MTNTKETQKIKTIVKYTSGSRLYGTHTPASDTDISGIFKARLNDIILQRDAKHITTTTATPNSANSANDVDVTFKELRTFIRDAIGGQSYAIEALFVPTNLLHNVSAEYAFLVENRDKLISHLGPILSYCRSMAHQFSMKGARLRAIEDAIEAFRAMENVAQSHERINDYRVWLPIGQYANIVPHDNGKGVKVDHYSINGLLFSLNLSPKYVRERLESKIKEYGHRAREAAIKGYEGKAYSHAIRLADEYLSLVETGSLQLPLSNAKFLREVKEGNVHSLIKVQEALDIRLQRVEELNVDTLRKPDRKFWDEWILSEYKK